MVTHGDTSAEHPTEPMDGSHILHGAPKDPKPRSTRAGPLVTPKECTEMMLLGYPMGKQLPQPDP